MNIFLLLILSALWGSSYLFIKIIVAEVPALTLVAGRLIVAALLMGMILRVRRVRMPRDPRTWVQFAFLGLVGAALPYSLISWGEQYISSGLASLLQATTPFFTIIVAHLTIDQERVTLHKIAGIVVGFVGVGLLMLPDIRQGQQSGLWGQLAVVLSSMCYAVSVTFTRRWQRGQSPLITATGQLTTSAIMMLSLSLLIDRPFDLSPSWPALASWVGLTLLGTVLAYIIYFTLIAQTSATFASLVTYVIPINGLILGAVVLGERLDLTVLGSLVLVLLGVALAQTR
jgi:drug/metabolite transporter (DMT)-like permease